jgi:integrase
MSADIEQLTEQEIELMLAVITSPQDLIIISLLCRVGLSAADITRLRLADLEDWKPGRYRAREHRKAPRLEVRRWYGFDEFFLRQPEAKAIRAWIRVRGRRAGPLFTSHFSYLKNHRITRNQILLLCMAYAKEAGIPLNKARPGNLSVSGLQRRRDEVYERLKGWA